MHDTKLVGDISETMVSVELLKRGFKVLKPIGDRLSYDLAVDLGGKLVRIQVKTAYQTKPGVYCGNVRSSKTNRKIYRYVPVDTTNVEFFVFVIQELSEFYVFPSSEVRPYKSGIRFTLKRQARKYTDPEDFRGRFDIIA